MQFWRGVIRLTKFSRCIVSGILLPISLLVSGAEGLSIADAAAVPECQTDYLALEGNLVLNPKIECDNNLDDLPDNWRTANTRAGYQTYWGERIKAEASLRYKTPGSRLLPHQIGGFRT